MNWNWVSDAFIPPDHRHHDYRKKYRRPLDGPLDVGIVVIGVVVVALPSIVGVVLNR